jgi:uncharacterized membrane protein HdeD (DUF308 family)
VRPYTGRVMKRTPRERASRLWRWALASIALGLVAGIVGMLVPGVLTIVAPALYVAAIVVGGIATTITTRKPELVWIVAGILIFWVVNSTIYLHLLGLANNTLADVPSQEAIDLLSTLFVAGVGALIVAGLIAIVAWVVRPGRWLSMNGPSGQS